MKRGVILVLMVFLVSVTIVSSGEDKVDDIIEEKLLENEKVKVIVVLKDEPSRRFFRRSVSAEKVKVLEKLDKKDFEKKHEFNVVNGFSGEITEEGLEKLKKDENVDKIYYDYPVKAFLTESVPLINASIVHSLQINNLNITGQDQTICIIDTGINYTHESFGGCSNDTFLDGNCSKILGGYDFVNNDTNPMDDEGHGTHVAGIVAANGNIIGVAPDAKIVSIKSLDGGGSGSMEDVIAGVDYCLTYKDIFNISIISLSLGLADEYNNEIIFIDVCDGNDPLVDALNNLTAYGISVVAAAGNDGNTTGITSPACGSNVTGVGAVNDNDDILYNRGSILNLLAPGNAIISTESNGAIGPRSGTSMATPHVSGAIVLLQQYNKLENNRSLSPDEIKDVLNKTGKQIYDNETNLTFSRIDVYEAIKYLTKPVINLISPSNNSVLINPIEFNISFEDYDEYLNCSLYINDELNQTNNISNGDIFSLNLSDGNYNSSIICFDNLDNYGESELINFRVDLTEPIIYLESPSDYEEVAGSKFISENTSMDFNFNVSDIEIENCSLLINNEVNATNADIDINISQTITTQLKSDTYNWSIQCFDKANWLGISEERQINVSCTEDWVCGNWSDWSDCDDDEKTRTRTCIDYNYCGTTDEKPSESDTDECEEDSGDSGDGSGSDDSGGDATTQSETESVLGFTASAGSTKTFSISKDVGITGVSVELNNDVTDARLTVSKLSEKPGGVTALNNVNRYIEIETLNLVEADVKEAIIKFKVAKTWISANADSVNHVYMHRYKDGKWNKLDTLTAGGDDEYQNYQATTSGFSYFAVNAEKTSTLITSNVPVAMLSSETEENKTNVTKKRFSFNELFSGSVVKNLTGKGIYNIIYIIAGLLVLGVLTYKRKVIISKVKEIKKPKFTGIKNKFVSVKNYLRKRKEKIKSDSVIRKRKKEESKIFRQQLKAAKKKDKIAKLEAKKELKLQKKAEERERYEVKDRGKENWEEFDVDWEE